MSTTLEFSEDQKAEIVKAKTDVEQIEKGIASGDDIIFRMFESKGGTIRYLAEQYEVLCDYKVIDLKVNQIANHIMRRLQKYNVVTKAWIYDSLQGKYKGHHPNPRNDDYESSKWTETSSYILDPKEENAEEIKFWNAQKVICDKIVKKLERTSYIGKKDESGALLIDPNEYRSYTIIRNAAQKFLADVWDDRKTVPLNTIHILTDVFITLNNNYSAGLYVSKLKEFGAEKKESASKSMKKLFSAKQLGNIFKGVVRELHESMEITTQKDAYANGFFGKINCEECDSWRIKLDRKYDSDKGIFKDPKLECYECGAIFDPPKVRLPLGKPIVSQTWNSSDTS